MIAFSFSSKYKLVPDFYPTACKLRGYSTVFDLHFRYTGKTALAGPPAVLSYDIARLSKYLLLYLYPVLECCLYTDLPSMIALD